MQFIELVESRPADLQLSDAEGLALQRAGRNLRSQKAWWGWTTDADSDGDVEDVDVDERSAITCAPAGTGHWRVIIHNAVGVIRVGDTQLTVRPKVPVPHLLFLFAESGELPRLPPDDNLRATLHRERNLWSLIAHWFVAATDRALRLEVARDYWPVTDELTVVRGRVSSTDLVRSAYQGRLQFLCEYDEFGENTPLNRVLRAAAEYVASSPLDWSLRRRAMRQITLLRDTGPLQSNDLETEVDRRTAHCADAPQLAVNVLRAGGRTIAHGGAVAWTFLIPTPSAIEVGVRTVLQNRLGSGHSVSKRGIEVSGVRFTPDLVFDGGAPLADVKYKIPRSDWNRSDLYQAVTFASAFASRDVGVIYFCPRGDSRPRELQLGNIRVSPLTWNADSNVNPDQAADEFVASVEEWLSQTAPKPNPMDLRHPGAIA